MKTLYLFTLSLLFSIVQLQAQCPTDLTLSTQLDIDNFATDYPGCNKISGTLTIEGSSSTEILNLDGLAQLDSITADLIVQNNDDLSSIAGLNSLTHIGGNINLSALNDLSSITALNNLTSVTGNLQLKFINGLTSLDGLENISTISGDLELQGLNNIPNLNPLSNLTSLTGALIINFNLDLTNLIGLEGLTTVDRLEIFGNTSLLNLVGLDNLTSVTTSIKINNHSNLLNMSGLDKLASCGSFFQIINNFALTSLTGLEALNTVGGQFRIDSNSDLASLSGLSGLSSIGSQFNLRTLATITNLNGLEALTSVGGQLEINGNGALISLDGIQNITTLTGDINIIGNTNLTDCAMASICNFIDNPPGAIVIAANSVGCSSVAQVETACAPVPVELTAFHGKVQMGVSTLNWTTASESDNKGFNIEYSEDGHHFKTIGFVPGAGESQEDVHYFFKHDNPNKGYIYYRLEQMDFTASAKNYSSAISINNTFSDLQVYPNPSQGSITLAGHLPESFKLIVSNIRGEEVMVIEENEGKQVDISGLENGVYFIQVFDQYHPEVIKVVLEK